MEEVAQIDGVMMNTVYDIRLEEFGRPGQTPCWTRIAWGKGVRNYSTCVHHICSKLRMEEFETQLNEG
jgi:hypothetical protein